MKLFIQQYQDIALATLSVIVAMFIVNIIVADITERINFSELETEELIYNGTENNKEAVKLYYPDSQRIVLVKNSVFRISDYVKLRERNEDIEITNTIIKVNGNTTERIDTSKCGGYVLTADINYLQNTYTAKLFITIEEY